jgi:hypothetical protein
LSKPLALCATAALALLTACGSSTAPTGGSTPSVSHTPTGPPTASGTTTGDSNVAGAFKVTSVSCSEPRPDGPAIRMFAQPPGQPANGISLVITIQAKGVVVRVASGSGATYAQREFGSTGGVTGFIAATGGRVVATLTEIPASAVNPSTIGAVKSITMTVDCANQQPGTATITVTGSTPSGAITGLLTSPRVQCSSYPQGDQVSVTALATIGGKPQLIITSVYWMGISAAVDSGFYTNTDSATGTATATKGHWNGDVTYGASGNKLHILGDATCGSSTAT